MERVPRCCYCYNSVIFSRKHYDNPRGYLNVFGRIIGRLVIERLAHDENVKKFKSSNRFEPLVTVYRVPREKDFCELGNT